MPAGTSPEVVRAIIALRFQGYRIKEIARETGVHHRTVSRKLDDFRKECRRVGVLKAAKNLDIQVDDLFKLAEDIHDKKVSIEEVIPGVPVASAAKQLGYKTENVGELMRLLVEDIQSKGRNPADFADNAYRLQEASRRLGTTYEDAVAKNQTLAEEIDEKKKELDETKEKSAEADAELQEKLDFNILTLSKIDEYSRAKVEMQKYGAFMDDYEKLATLIGNVKDYMKDPHALISHYSSTLDAEKHLTDLQEEHGKLEDQNKRLTEENKQLEQESYSLRSQVEAAKILSVADVSPPQAKAIADTVKQIALKHGIPRSTAVDTFAKDLVDFYDPLKEFDNRIDFLEKKQGILEDRVQELVLKKERLEEDYENDLTSIKSLQALNQSGVGNEHITELCEILKENNIDGPTLREEIKRLGGLPRAIDEIRGELTELEARKTSLTFEVETLEKRHRDMSELNTRVAGKVSDDLEKIAKGTRDVIDQLNAEVLSPKTGLRPQALKLVDKTIGKVDENLQSHEEEFKASLERLVKEVDEAKRTVNQLIKNSNEAGKLMGGLINLDSVTRLTQGKPLEASEELVAVISMVTALMIYMHQKGHDACVRLLNSFIDTYKREAGSAVT